MNYELAGRKYVSDNENSVNPYVSFNYGALPYDMLIKKYEETENGSDENQYDTYARGVVRDFRPDTLFTAADEPRGRVNGSSGKLQLWHYGHRGEADPANHSEIFQDFIGGSWIEPRRYAIDPDMKQLTAQEQARMKYKRFTPDDSPHITGGRLSEEQEIAVRQDVFKWTRDRLAIFSSQKDGRREGLRKAWRNVSAAANQELAPKYGATGPNDMLYVSDSAIQRNLIIMQQAVRDSRAFRDSTCDGLKSASTVHSYGHIRRAKLDFATMQPLAYISTEHKVSNPTDDKVASFKALGGKIRDLVKARDLMSSGVANDADYGENMKTQMRKHEGISKDIGQILQLAKQEQVWGQTDQSMAIKTPGPSQAEHLARMTMPNHLDLNYPVAELMYKSVQPGTDPHKITIAQVTDAANAQLAEAKTKMLKRAADKFASGGATKGISNIDLDDDSTKVHNYKTAHLLMENKVVNWVGEEFKTESDYTQNRAINHEEYHNIDKRDISTDGYFLDNQNVERLAAPLGQKSRARRHIQRDGANISNLGS